MPPPETFLDYVAAVLGTIAGVMSDAVALVVMVSMVAAGHRNRSGWLPLAFAISYQVVVSAMMRPYYHQHYPSAFADTYLMEDAQAPFVIRLTAFYAAWLLGKWWATRQQDHSTL